MTFTREKNQGINAREIEKRIYLDFLHENFIITFAHPPKGPNTYFKVREQLLKQELETPTTSQNISLVHAAWQNPKEKYSKEVIDIIRNRWLWCFTGILYVPNEGAYILDKPEVKDDKIIMNKSDLTKRLEEKDSRARFVPFGYKIGPQTIRELSKNKFLYNLVGEETTEKLAETCGEHKHKPFISSFNNIEEELVRVVAFNYNPGLEWFYLLGDCYGSDRGGSSFGHMLLVKSA